MLPTYDLRAVIAALRPSPHIGAMHLDLSDEEAAALTQELHDIVENDRYPFSSHPHAEGHSRQAQTGAGAQALAPM